MMQIQKYAALVALLLALCLLLGCGSGSSAPASGASAPSVSHEGISAPDLDAPVQSGAVDEAGAVTLVLSDASGDVLISQAGTYVLSGKRSDGQILIDAPSGAKVKLILNGVDLTKRGGAVLYAREADRVTLASAPGSVNRLCSLGEFGQAEGSGVDAAVFARCDLTLNGEGVLNIRCEGAHGLVCKDDLKLKGGTVNVVAGKKGLEGKDSLKVEGGALYVESGGKGLSAGEEARSLQILGGSATVLSRDDALHAGGILVAGGSLLLSSGDDAMHADGALTVNGGSIRILRSHEGMEAAAVTINGGTISILASEDGVNASGGGGGSCLTVNGGTLFINAEGDGLDANGELRITGGEVYISGPTHGGNGALDYGARGVITGGTVVAVGSAGMAVNFGSASTQGSILLRVGTLEAGSAVTLTDAEGRVLVSYTPEKRYESVVISCPGLAAGASYTLSAGSYTETVTLTELIYGSGMGALGMPPPGGRP